MESSPVGFNAHRQKFVLHCQLLLPELLLSGVFLPDGRQRGHIKVPMWDEVSFAHLNQSMLWVVRLLILLLELEGDALGDDADLIASHPNDFGGVAEAYDVVAQGLHFW